MRPQGRRAVGRCRPRRAAAEHAGSCSPAALRLWDVSGRRAGSSSPALLSGPPPPPSASSSLACSRASPFPHRRVSPRLLQRIQSRVAEEKEEEAPVPARHPPPYWTRTRERERRRGSLRRRQGHRRLSRRRGFRLSQLAGEGTPAPLARSCGAWAGGAGENEGGGRGAPTPALGGGD